MFVKQSQAANTSTLIEAKKRSSLVISEWSNKRVQRSARIEILILDSVRLARPLTRRPLDPRRASRAGVMLDRPSQMAHVSTLLDVKKKSSLVL